MPFCATKSVYQSVIVIMKIIYKPLLACFAAGALAFVVSTADAQRGHGGFRGSFGGGHLVVVYVMAVVPILVIGIGYGGYYHALILISATLGVLPYGFIIPLCGVTKPILLFWRCFFTSLMQLRGPWVLCP